jgi:hypothetical protein
LAGPGYGTDPCLWCGRMRERKRRSRDRPKVWPIRLVLLGLALGALCSCGRRPGLVGQVGETAITETDLAYRQAVMAVRSGKEFPGHLALLQLIEESLMVEVGRAHGVVVSEELLEDEAARVQATSRDPQTLARIRAVFGDDEGAYRRLVLQPILVNQLLHARFSLGHDIQAEPLARAREALDAALADPTSLSALAEVYGGEYRELQIVAGRIRYGDEPPAAEDGPHDALPSDLAQYDLEWPDYDREFVEQVVAGLEAGELHAKVVEDRYSFMVVRLLSREGDDALLEAAVFAKLAFDPWFHTQCQLVPLVIHDRALQEALLDEVDLPYITGRLEE